MKKLIAAAAACCLSLGASVLHAQGTMKDAMKKPMGQGDMMMKKDAMPGMKQDGMMNKEPMGQGGMKKKAPPMKKDTMGKGM